MTGKTEPVADQTRAESAVTIGQPPESQEKPQPLNAADITKLERERIAGIRNFGKIARVEESTINDLIERGINLSDAKNSIIEKWGKQVDAETTRGDASVTTDEKDKFILQGVNALCARAGQEKMDSGNAMRGMLGGYSNLEQATDALADNHAHVVTVLEAALSAGAAGGFNVTWAAGCEQSGFDTAGIAPAAAAAAAADFAVVVLGDGGESVGYDSSVSCGEGADRPSLDIPGVQLALLAAVLETGTPTAVVVTHGRPFTLGSDYGGSAVSSFSPPLDERAGAVLAAWRPGCEGGGAIWDLLTGAASPSGRLAQSWPRAAGAVHIGGISPQYIKFSVQGGQGWTLGAPFSPLFALGHGLDYLNVSFGASSAAVDAAAQTMTVSVDVVNAASAAGAYVVQVYFTQQVSRFSRSQKQLGGWTKAALPAAGSASPLPSAPLKLRK